MFNLARQNQRGRLGSGRVRSRGNIKNKMSGLSQSNSQDVTQPFSQGITQGMSQVFLHTIFIRNIAYNLLLLSGAFTSP